MAKQDQSKSDQGRGKLVHSVIPWLLSAVAIGAAYWISHQPPFQRVSAVVSDEISRILGVTSRGTVVLVRIDRDFPRNDLQTLLARAIPALMDNYRAAALGVDIDFSHGDYDQLAIPFANWSRARPDPARRIIWAIGYDSNGERGTPKNEPEVCSDCESDQCKFRFHPRPVFSGLFPGPNYGLAYVWTDVSGVARSSFRFVCSQESTSRLPTFHFKLVEAYCSDHPSTAVCEKLQQNRQSTARLDTWYEAEPLDLCKLVDCNGRDKERRHASRRMNSLIRF
jgi:hypothetical protein